MRREITVGETPLGFYATLRLAGANCRVSANSDIVVQGLGTWLASRDLSCTPSFSLQIFVRPGRRSGSSPHFRGRKHLVIASFGADNVFTFDLVRRNVTAVVTPDTSADQPFWDRLLLPIAIGILGPSFGVVPVHSACLVAEGTGLLIAGDSGAGKSTLSVALAQEGFGFVSDDWTYLSLNCGRLVAHGLSVPAKLLPDSVRYFSALQRFRPSLALNQEMAYEVPCEELGADVQLSCEPNWFFFLERTLTQSNCKITPMAPDESHRYVRRTVERLPSELDSVVATRAAVIAHMPLLSCWKLTYGGPPTIAVQGLQDFVTAQRQCLPV